MIHNEHTQENPRINQQDRQKITFLGSANPKDISQQCTPATHTEAVHCQRVLLGFPSLSLTTKGSWITFGGGSPNLSSALWRQYPLKEWVIRCAPLVFQRLLVAPILQSI